MSISRGASFPQTRHTTWYERGDIEALLAMDPQDIRVVDLETTGLSPDTDEILQAAIVDGTGELLVCENFRPSRTRSWLEAQCVHGLSPQDLSVYDTVEAHLLDLTEGLSPAHLLVGYNLAFDLAFLREEGVCVPACEHFDVMREFAPVANRWSARRGAYRWQPLSRCATHYGVRYHAHDALADARATLACYRALLQDDGTEYRSMGSVPYLEVVERHARRI